MRRLENDLHLLDVAPDLSAWAIADGSAQPSLAEHHPGTTYWRDLVVDPGLVGLKPGRGRVTRLRIDGTAGRGWWTVPVSGLLGGLAWHPRRPLVAGLMVAGRDAHPWIADYEARVATVYDRVRAATSLTELALRRCAPLVWHDDNRLLLLVPPPQPSPTPQPGPQSAPAPAVYEAAGPGQVEFHPPLEELTRLAAASIAELDPDSGRIVALTPPRLIRDVSAAITPGLLRIECAVGAPDRDGLRWSTLTFDPATRSMRSEPVAAERTLWRGGDGMTISHRNGSLRLITAGQVHRLALPADVAQLGGSAPPPPPPWEHSAPSRLVLDCTSTAGRPGVAVIDRDVPEVTVVWAPEPGDSSLLGIWAADRGGTVELVTHGMDGVRHYRLRDGELERTRSPIMGVPATAATAAPTQHVPLGPADLVVIDQDADPAGPLLLWLHPTVSGDGGSRDAAVPRTFTATGHPCAALRLPVRWPRDATPAMLSDQIVDSVAAAMEALVAGQRDRFNGRIVVAGHSFGATLALFVLAHLPDLASAIAHNGCYNRTLVPTGFQFETRPYWAAPDVYHTFSPLLFADRLDRPVLIVHGAEDTNPATPPAQAVDLYRGVVAAGGHARLVLLPYEGHTYRHAESRQSLVDIHREWLDRWRDQVDR